MKPVFEPLVSIIIPSFNREKLIIDTLESVSSQQYSHWECIIIDDGSTDNTVRVTQEYIKGNQKFQFIHRDRLPKGAPTCRNIGLAKSKGEFIQFLDSDDVLLDTKIAHQVSLLEKDKGIDIIHGSYQESRFDKEPNKTIITSGNSNQWLNFFSGIGNTCANMFLSQSVKNVKGWDEKLKSGQEPDLMFRMYQNGVKVICDLSPLTLIRVQASGITGSDQKGNYSRYSQFVFRVYDYLLLQSLISEGEKKMLNEKIYNVIRVLYRVDKINGKKAYLKYVNSSHIWPNAQWEISSNYLSLYRLLGFRATERLLHFLGK